MGYKRSGTLVDTERPEDGGGNTGENDGLASASPFVDAASQSVSKI